MSQPYLNPNEKQKVNYCVPLWQRDEQIKLSIERNLPRFEAVYEVQQDPIAIVGYGPSLNDTWEQIKDFKHIITCSGSHQFLLQRGIVPTWHVDVDPRPHKAELIGDPHPDVEYLIASACHPNVFEKLKGFNVKIWHIFGNESEAYQLLPPGEWAITGGSSAGLRILSIARLLGFTNFHIFGMDGSEGKSGKHAAYHPNQPNGNFPSIYEGITYYTTPAMLHCTQETFHELDLLKDVTFHFYGEGLTQHMAKNYQRKPIDVSTIVAYRKPLLISDEYRKLNYELHKSNISYGIGGIQHVGVVMTLYKDYNCESILDYGCGKGYLGKNLPFPIWEYDPAIPGKDSTPRSADIVVCTDVLEHIEEDKLNVVLLDLMRCVKKIGYFTIHLSKSIKTLADGRNTHLIIRPADWWVEKLNEFFEVGSPHVDEHGLAVCVIPKYQFIIKEEDDN